MNTWDVKNKWKEKNKQNSLLTLVPDTICISSKRDYAYPIAMHEHHVKYRASKRPTKRWITRIISTKYIDEWITITQQNVYTYIHSRVRVATAPEYWLRQTENNRIGKSQMNKALSEILERVALGVFFYLEKSKPNSRFDSIRFTLIHFGEWNFVIQLFSIVAGYYLSLSSTVQNLRHDWPEKNDSLYQRFLSKS